MNSKAGRRRELSGASGWALPILLVVMLVGVWQLAAVSGFLADRLGLEDFLVPAPAEIAEVLWQDRSLIAENAG